ncbi:unnamed protein product [Alopecurus aequalis]
MEFRRRRNLVPISGTVHQVAACSRWRTLRARKILQAIMLDIQSRAVVAALAVSHNLPSPLNQIILLLPVTAVGAQSLGLEVSYGHLLLYFKINMYT